MNRVVLVQETKQPAACCAHLVKACVTAVAQQRHNTAAEAAQLREVWQAGVSPHNSPHLTERLPAPTVECEWEGDAQGHKAKLHVVRQAYGEADCYAGARQQDEPHAVYVEGVQESTQQAQAMLSEATGGRHCGGAIVVLMVCALEKQVCGSSASEIESAGTNARVARWLLLVVTIVGLLW